MGEVGLAGEVRQVPGAARRLAEAVRLGFGRAIVPMATPAVEGAALVRVGLARRGPRTRRSSTPVRTRTVADPRRRLPSPGDRCGWSKYPEPHQPGDRGTRTSAHPRRAPNRCSPRLRLAAPGTLLREGIQHVLQAHMGALHRHRRRPRGPERLFGRLPARRRVHPAASVRAREDGRRDHRHVRLRADRAGERPPRPRPEHPDGGDGHAPPHRRTGRPPDLGAGRDDLRGPLRGRRPHGWREADARAHPARAGPRRPGAPDPRALQDPSRRCERLVVGARGRGPRHRPRRRDGPATGRDGAADL